MKLGNLNSLHIGLIALLVVAVIVAGVSYSRQKKAENQVAVMANAIKSATNLEALQNSADIFVAYSGAGSKASAGSPYYGDNDCGPGEQAYQATRGDDAGQIYCSGGSSWWNPFSWF